MADLGELVLRLRVDDGEYTRSLEDARRRAASLKDIRVDFNSQKAVNGLQNIDSGLRKLPAATASVGKSFSALQGIIAGATAAITASLIRVGAAVLNIPRQLAGISLGNFRDFDSELQQFSALTGKARDDIAPLTDEIKRLGVETTKAPTEIAAAANELITLGANADDVQNQLAGVVALSEATGVGLTQAGELIQLASNTFGSSSDEIADKLSVLRNTTAASVGDVQQLIQQAGGIFNSLGDSADPDELFALFATLRDGGLNAEVAATGLRGVIATLVDPAKAKDLEQLGISAFDAEGNFLGFEAILRQLQKTQATLNPSDFTGQLVGAFGREGVAAVTTGLDLLDSKFTKTFGNIRDSVGTAAESSSVLTQGFAGSLKILQGSLETLSIAFGEALAPIAQALAQLGISLTNALLESGVFDGLTAAANSFLTLIQGSEAFVTSLGQTLVQSIGGVVGAISDLVGQAVAAIQNDPQAVLAGIQQFISQLGSAIVSTIQGIAGIVQFVVANFDAIVLGAQSLAAVLVAAFTGNAVAGIVNLGTTLFNLAKSIIPLVVKGFAFISTAFTAVSAAFASGGISAAFAAIVAAATPILATLAAVAAAVGAVILIFKALRSERGQEILGAIAEKARELFEAFRDSEAVQAFVSILRSIGGIAQGLAVRFGQLAQAVFRFIQTDFKQFIAFLGGADTIARNLKLVLIDFNPPLQIAIKSAEKLAGVLLAVLKQTGTILANLDAALNGPKTNEGLNTAPINESFGQAITGLSKGLSNIREEAKSATEAVDDLNNAAEDNPVVEPPDPTRDLEAEAKAAADALAAAEKKVEDEKIARELAFEDSNRAKDLAFEDAKLARQQAFEDSKRATALALEDEIERRKIATEEQIEAIKEEGRRREEEFNRKQQQDEQEFNDRQNQEKLAFENDLAARRQQAERNFDIGEAESLDERNNLVLGFAKEDRRAAALAPFEEEQRAFEAQQEAEKRAFEEQQRLEQAAFEEEQRALDLQAQELKAQSEADIRALNLAAKEEEIARERSFQANERSLEQQFQDAERSRQRAFNEQERLKDLENARAIERLKASSGSAPVDAITAFKHGGPFSAGQLMLAGEAGPEMLRMGGKDALITQPSLMRFDQPGRIYSAPRTRRKMSEGTLSRAGVGGELAQMRKLLKASLAKPAADINTTVEIQGMSPDAMRKQLALHQLDLYRSLGGF